MALYDTSDDYDASLLPSTTINIADNLLFPGHFSWQKVKMSEMPQQ